MNNILIYNNHKEAKKVLTKIKEELSTCTSFYLNIAFITDSGIITLLDTFKELEKKGVQGKILTTNYLLFNNPSTIEKLNTFSNIEIKIFDSITNNIGFHTKGYIFEHDTYYSTIIGSSNLTANALLINKEWNLFTTYQKNNETLKTILLEFFTLWENSSYYEDIKHSYKKQYTHSLLKNKEFKVNTPQLNTNEDIKPNKMQKNFIEKFIALRKIKETKALLISATGTGKTYAAALAMKEIQAKKVLFIVHREQIAKKSLETFKKIFKETRTFSLLSGTNKYQQADFIFSTIQSLSKDNILESFPKEYFDEIIIDEVHKAGAASYIKIINYFNPKFYLGMTATPDRSDQFNIYELFDNNIVYEIRLKEAMEENLLCPFHYFAIHDISINNTEISDLSSFSQLTHLDRVNHIIEKIKFYGFSGSRVKGLVFCSSISEAEELSKLFNKQNYKTSVLTGKDTIKNRERTIKKLITDKQDEDYLDYIFTVDVFNEGIDIPEVNQIIMLRPTQSSIIFIQQLGRGLRKYKNKDFVVILDFIANYKNNFLIPIALSGDNNLDKDNLRKFLTQATNILPDSSTINFDKVSREKIYQAIDNVKFDTWSEVTNNYIKIKNKLGKIPTYTDIDRADAINCEKIFKVCGSYENFLYKKEKEFYFEFTPIQLEVLQFISQNLILSKKIEELILLKLLIEKKNNIYEKFKTIMINIYNKIITDNELDTTIKILTNMFVTSKTTKKKFENCIFLSLSKNKIEASDELKKLIENKDFKYHLLSLINYGIENYNLKYRDNLYKETNFVLYEKYTYQDICKLFNWSINYVPLAIGGYKYDENTKTLPVFINYDIDENSFNHDYTHGFLENGTVFTSMSKPNRNLSSKEMTYVCDKNTKIYLFMKKNKLDKDDSTGFYFLGELTNKNIPKLIHRKKSKDTVLQFTFNIETPIREDIYNYLTKVKI